MAKGPVIEVEAGLDLVIDDKKLSKQVAESIGQATRIAVSQAGLGDAVSKEFSNPATIAKAAKGMQELLRVQQTHLDTFKQNIAKAKADDGNNTNPLKPLFDNISKDFVDFNRQIERLGEQGKHQVNQAIKAFGGRKQLHKALQNQSELEYNDSAFQQTMKNRANLIQKSFEQLNKLTSQSASLTRAQQKQLQSLKKDETGTLFNTFSPSQQKSVRHAIARKTVEFRQLESVAKSFENLGMTSEAALTRGSFDMAPEQLNDYRNLLKAQRLLRAEAKVETNFQKENTAQSAEQLKLTKDRAKAERQRNAANKQETTEQIRKQKQLDNMWNQRQGKSQFTDAQAKALINRPAPAPDNSAKEIADRNNLLDAQQVRIDNAIENLKKRQRAELEAETNFQKENTAQSAEQLKLTKDRAKAERQRNAANKQETTEQIRKQKQLDDMWNQRQGKSQFTDAQAKALINRPAPAPDNSAKEIRERNEVLDMGLAREAEKAKQVTENLNKFKRELTAERKEQVAIQKRNTTAQLAAEKRRNAELKREYKTRTTQQQKAPYQTVVGTRGKGVDLRIGSEDELLRNQARESRRQALQEQKLTAERKAQQKAESENLAERRKQDSLERKNLAAKRAAEKRRKAELKREYKTRTTQQQKAPYQTVLGTRGKGVDLRIGSEDKLLRDQARAYYTQQNKQRKQQPPSGGQPPRGSGSSQPSGANRLVGQFARYGIGYMGMYRISGAIAALVRDVVELDKQFYSIQAVVGATDAEMAGMETTIKRLATTTKFTTTEIAMAAKVLGQAGVEVDEMGKVLESTALFAAATDSSLELSADLLSTMRNVFDDIDPSTMADQLTRTINISKTNAADLKTIASISAQTARSYNLSSEQYFAAVSTLRNAGLKASTVSTGLRQGLTEMFTPDNKVLDAMMSRYRKLGEEMTEMQVQQRFASFTRADNPLVAAMTELRRLGFGSDGDQEFMRSFNIRAMNALRALNDQFDELIENESKLTFGQAAAEASDTQMRSLANTLANLRAAFTSFGDTILKGPINSLQKFAKSATEGVMALERLDIQMKAAGKSGLSSVAGTGMAGMIGGLAAGSTPLGRVGAGVAGLVAGTAAGYGSATDDTVGKGLSFAVSVAAGLITFAKPLLALAKSKGTQAAALAAAGKTVATVSIGVFAKPIALAVGLATLIKSIGSWGANPELDRLQRQADAANRELELSRDSRNKQQEIVDEYTIDGARTKEGTTAFSIQTAQDRLDNYHAALRAVFGAGVEATEELNELLARYPSQIYASREQFAKQIEAMTGVAGSDSQLYELGTMRQGLGAGVDGLREALKDWINRTQEQLNLGLITSPERRSSAEVLLNQAHTDKDVQAILAGNTDHTPEELQAIVSRYISNSAELFESVAERDAEVYEDTITSLITNFNHDLENHGAGTALNRLSESILKLDLLTADTVERINQHINSTIEELEGRTITQFVPNMFGPDWQGEHVQKPDLPAQERAETLRQNYNQVTSATETRLQQNDRNRQSSLDDVGQQVATVEVSLNHESFDRFINGLSLEKQGDKELIERFRDDPEYRESLTDTANPQLYRENTDGSVEVLGRGELGRILNLIEGFQQNQRAQTEGSIEARRKRELGPTNEDLTRLEQLEEEVKRLKTTKDYYALNNTDDGGVLAQLRDQRELVYQKQLDLAEFEFRKAEQEEKDSSAHHKRAEEAQSKLDTVKDKYLTERTKAEEAAAKYWRDRRKADRKAEQEALKRSASDLIQNVNRGPTTGDKQEDVRRERMGGFSKEEQTLKLNDDVLALKQKVDEITREQHYAEAIYLALDEQYEAIRDDVAVAGVDRERLQADLSDARDEVYSLIDALDDLNFTLADTQDKLDSIATDPWEQLKENFQPDALQREIQGLSDQTEVWGKNIQQHVVKGFDDMTRSMGKAILNGDSLSTVIGEMVHQMASDVFTTTFRTLANQLGSAALGWAGGFFGKDDEDVEGGSGNDLVDAALSGGGKPVPVVDVGKATSGLGVGGGPDIGDVVDELGDVADSEEAANAGFFGTLGNVFTTGFNGVKSFFTSFLPGLFSTLIAAITGLFASSKSADIAGGIVGAAASAATGGVIKGKGTGTSDSIPGVIKDSKGIPRRGIMVSNGESILNAKATKMLGEDFVHSVNNGRIAKMAVGGMIKDSGRTISSATTPVDAAKAASGYQPPEVSVREGDLKIVNVVDKGLMAQYLESRDGEKVVLNVMRKNGVI